MQRARVRIISGAVLVFIGFGAPAFAQTPSPAAATGAPATTPPAAVKSNAVAPSAPTDTVQAAPVGRPVPDGGYKNYFQYLNSAAKLPLEAQRLAISGKVVIEFKVNVDGSLIDFRVAEGLGHGCDEEAIRVIREGPKWTPGQKDGKPVVKTLTIPVVFGK